MFRASVEYQPVQADDDPTAARILETAIEVIATRGYHGTSVRDIAQAANVSAGSIYNHYESKQGLLDVIINRGMDGLLAVSEQALYDAPANPVDRLDALVAAHVRAHAGYGPWSSIGNAELRSLEPPRLAVVVAKRDTQQRMFDRVITDGVTQGLFVTPDPAMAAKYVVTACTSVAGWYRIGGRLDLDELIEQYQVISRNAVGYRGGQAGQP
ncbi:TetR family transcriptional regulator [Nocardia sp. NPDC059246]|uniref:TetR family transcriptional regulator n=1 Tax=unclassified Nocardia TaxID=2637762 RepID=UPI00367A8ABD